LNREREDIPEVHPKTSEREGIPRQEGRGHSETSDIGRESLLDENIAK
tara:strand:+ start:436 stop:579 length:144 start_codon:yes stop_codon:yes gene_type:complete